MIGGLPETLTVGGREYPIRTDYRDVLQVLEAFSDEELEHIEKWIVAVYLLFEDFSCADDVLEAVEDGFDLGEAVEQISWFLSVGKLEEKDRDAPLYDWKQDEQMIFAAVNKVAGREVREADYMHWWTISGYVNSVDKDDFWTFVISIRDKLNKKKKLEKNEREFLNKNRELVILEKRKTREEQELKMRYKALLNRML
ncbi:MAG: hypothetical protein HFI60_13280 [Lachnospiraceae bacterium]|jgi:hypothetical protein|nr:hypothetical protein [Lachnospiraceae bacterium]